ncbi:MAG: pirin-like C-terminal cupin domain-containing protein, partial [bacterium]
VFEFPAAAEGLNRTLYCYRGNGLKISGTEIPHYHAADVVSHHVLKIEAGADEARILVLQGKPINEPVIQYGPFVMNTEEQIRQCISDYQNGKMGDPRLVDR